MPLRMFSIACFLLVGTAANDGDVVHILHITLFSTSGSVVVGVQCEQEEPEHSPGGLHFCDDN